MQKQQHIACARRRTRVHLPRSTARGSEHLHAVRFGDLYRSVRTMTIDDDDLVETRNT